MSHGMQAANKTFNSNQYGENLSEHLKKLIKTLSNDKAAHNEMYSKALDDLLNVNSLFKVAVFIGLSFASRNQQAREDAPKCSVDPLTAERLVVYKVVSFGAFLLSSLIAKSMKVHLKNFRDTKFEQSKKWRICRGFMFFSAVLSSEIGVLFLTLSMINLVQLTIGKLSCGSGHAVAPVAALCTLVGLAVLVYLSSMVYAIIYSVLHANLEPEEKEFTV